MDNVVIRELYRNSENYFSKEVKVSGWVRTVRDSKTFGFIELNDGSYFKNIQIESIFFKRILLNRSDNFLSL